MNIESQWTGIVRTLRLNCSAGPQCRCTFNLAAEMIERLHADNAELYRLLTEQTNRALMSVAAEMHAILDEHRTET